MFKTVDLERGCNNVYELNIEYNGNKEFFRENTSFSVVISEDDEEKETVVLETNGTFKSGYHNNVIQIQYNDNGDILFRFRISEIKYQKIDLHPILRINDREKSKNLNNIKIKLRCLDDDTTLEVYHLEGLFKNEKMVYLGRIGYPENQKISPHYSYIPEIFGY